MLYAQLSEDFGYGGKITGCSILEYKAKILEELGEAEGSAHTTRKPGYDSLQRLDCNANSFQESRNIRRWNLPGLLQIQTLKLFEYFAYNFDLVITAARAQTSQKLSSVFL
jgi:hypothetical protein